MDKLGFYLDEIPVFTVELLFFNITGFYLLIFGVRR